MFDLFRSRDKAMRYLLGVLLGLVALSLVITLIPGFGASTGPREELVAEIGGEALTVREVQQTLQGALRNRQLPPEMIQFYVPQMIDQMITERAVAYQATRMGFKVTDQEVADAIRSMLAQYFPGGDIPQDAYQRFLSQQNLTVKDFERNIRLNLLLMRLQNLALEGAIVTPDEVEKEYRRKNDKIKVDYIKFTAPTDLRNQVSVTPDEIKSFYTTQKARFNTPEKRSWTLLSIDDKKIAAGLQMPEAELLAAYNATAEKFRTPERVHVRHILLKTSEKSPDDVKKAEAKANELLKQVKAGGDFAKLAKDNSEDVGSAVKGGDLDWVVKGQTVPAFETSAFSLKPKEISNLIKTEYGFHIIQVLEKEEARVKPFEEVRAQVAADRQRDAVFAKMQQVVDQARAELAKAPGSADQIAAKYGMEIGKAEKVGAGAPIPGVGSSPQVDGTVNSMKKGEVSQPIQVTAERLGVAVVTDLFPAHPAELAEVENEIRESLMAQKTAAIADQKVREATDKLKAGVAAGTDLAALGKSIGAKYGSADAFSLEGAAEGIGPATSLAEGFSKPVGSLIGPFNVGGEVFVAKVTEKQPADVARLAADRDTLVLALKRKRATERKELFDDGILTQLIKDGKVKKYQDVINRIMQGYRG